MMKIRLVVGPEKYQQIRLELERSGIEVSDTADLVLSEVAKAAEPLLLKSAAGNEWSVVAEDDLIYAESFGHSLELHTAAETYTWSEPLYRLLLRLNNEKFLRISNSVIINCDKVKHISPTLSMKFILTMQNGAKVDVTRSYYYIFKERFGI